MLSYWDAYLRDEAVSVADGIYDAGEYEITIKDGKVDTIFNSIVDEDQLSLFDESLELVA